MDISEAETGTMLAVSDLDIAAAIREVAALYEDIAEEKSVTLAASAPDGLVARADRDLAAGPCAVIQSVLRNAISARLSSSDRFNPNGWPGMGRVRVPGGFQPFGR